MNRRNNTIQIQNGYDDTHTSHTPTHTHRHTTFRIHMEDEQLNECFVSIKRIPLFVLELMRLGMSEKHSK